MEVDSLLYPSPSAARWCASSTLDGRRDMNKKTTKRAIGRKGAAAGVEESAPEYRFDYAKSRPNRFARPLRRGALVVVLDPDVAKVFRDAKQVNSLLRATIAAVEKPHSRRTG